MIQIICLVAFFGTLVIGSLIVDALGRLPDAEELQEQDRERFAGMSADSERKITLLRDTLHRAARDRSGADTVV